MDWNESPVIYVIAAGLCVLLATVHAATDGCYAGWLIAAIGWFVASIVQFQRNEDEIRRLKELMRQAEMNRPS